MNKRKILHVDLDCFYVSVERLQDPALALWNRTDDTDHLPTIYSTGLAGQPVLVGGDPEGRGVVASASYEARAFGVHSAMPMAQALRRCPEAIVVNPRHHLYREYSEQVMDILHEVTSIVEKLSIDEAYGWCPTCDIVGGTPPGVVETWAAADETAGGAQRRLKDELGLPSSWGVATNKLVAKIASDQDKPEGLVVVPLGTEAEFLAPLPVEELWGVGPACAGHADRHQHRNGRILIRRGSENVALLGEALRQTLLEREQPSFDDRPVWESDLDDLDPSRLEWYLKRSAQERNIPVDLSLPQEQNLIRLGAVIRDEQRAVPRVAGLLLFGKEPQRFVPQSTVRLARFQGKQPLNFIDRLDCTGTLPEMIDEAERFVKRNTRVAAKVTGFERREVTEYPYPAIREAIANAVAHRDYWREDVRVRVSIFADRIEVQSPGRLPAPLTLDTLGEDYALRNHLIAQLLFNIRYIEAWNTGIPSTGSGHRLRMRRWMEQHGLPEPVFEEIGQSFRVTFYGPGEEILDLIPEEGVTDLRDLGLNERQIEALRLMVNEKKELPIMLNCRLAS